MAQLQQAKVLGVVGHITLGLQTGQHRVAGAAPALLGADKGIARHHHHQDQRIGQVLVVVAVQAAQQGAGAADAQQVRDAAFLGPVRRVGCVRQLGGRCACCFCRSCRARHTAAARRHRCRHGCVALGGGLVAARQALGLVAPRGAERVFPQPRFDLQLGAHLGQGPVFFAGTQRLKGVLHQQRARHKSGHHRQRAPRDVDPSLAFTHGGAPFGGLGKTPTLGVWLRRTIPRLAKAAQALNPGRT